MPNGNARTTFSAFLALGAVLTSVHPAHAASYTLTKLGTDIKGEDGAQPAAINESGQIVGFVTIAQGQAGAPYPFVWTPTSTNGTSGGSRVVEPSSAATGHGNATNASGAVVGYLTFGSTSAAFLDSGSTLTDLGALSGDASSFATGINASGEICGTSSSAPGHAGEVMQHAFVSRGGSLQFLGSLGNGTSAATGINDTGEVVGFSELSGQPDAAVPFLVSGGTMFDMSGSGGFPELTVDGTLAINASGQVAGSMEVSGMPGTHIFLWTPSMPHGTKGTFVDLGTLSGFPECSLGGLNDAGDVVATCEHVGKGSSSVFHAALSQNGGQVVDLNALVPSGSPVLSSATGINDAGQIVGTSAPNQSSTLFGYLLTPYSAAR